MRPFLALNFANSNFKFEGSSPVLWGEGGRRPGEGSAAKEGATSGWSEVTRYNLFQLDGFIVIDKPEGQTSHDVVQAVRKRLRVRKVGHLGTLDPMATGVLPLALGKATRLVEFLKGGRKAYQGTIRLGFSTDTYDREGRPSSEIVVPEVTQEQLTQQAAKMLGQQLQSPPPFSAKKVQGVPAYRLARQGKAVSLAACSIHIDALSFTLSASKTENVDFTICCSAGTYVRSVAHELGRNLGCGAHLVRLRRTKSGEFSLSQSLTLHEFERLTPEVLAARLIPLNEVLGEFPVLQADAEAETAIAQGRVFSCGSAEGQPQSRETSWRRVLSSEGLLIALAKPVAVPGTKDLDHSTAVLWHPAVVLITRDKS